MASVPVVEQILTGQRGMSRALNPFLLLGAALVFLTVLLLVLQRYLHTFIHVTSNRVTVRFYACLAGAVPLPCLLAGGSF